MERAWGRQGAKATDPRGARAMHGLWQVKGQVSHLQQASHPIFTSQVLLPSPHSHLQQQPVDLLRQLVDIRVQRQSWVGGRGCEHILVQGCPVVWGGMLSLVLSFPTAPYPNPRTLPTQLHPPPSAGSAHLRAYFMATQYKGHLTAPGVNEAGPAGVHGDILPITGTEADRGVVKGLACQL